VLLLVATAVAPAFAQIPPTLFDSGADSGVDPALDLDQDNDGLSPNQGDCDDANRDVHPGLAEVCGDRLDNDCNGLYDDTCDDAVHLASLRGGGGCTAGGGIAGTTALLLLPLWTTRRRA
jgi:Synergist-CTERM protein sorting domain-containing protein